jgi:TonB family protein
MEKIKRCLLSIIICGVLLGLRVDVAQAAADDDRLRACVAVLSNSLRTGMSANDYPREAFEHGIGGAVQLQLMVDHLGALGTQTLVQSSGDATIDDAAMQGARRLFPTSTPAPAECRLGYTFTAVLSVVFKVLPGPVTAEH